MTQTDGKQKYIIVYKSKTFGNIYLTTRDYYQTDDESIFFVAEVLNTKKIPISGSSHNKYYFMTIKIMKTGEIVESIEANLNNVCYVTKEEAAEKYLME